MAEKYLENATLSKIANKNAEIVKSVILRTLQDANINHIDEDWGEIKLHKNRFNVKLK